MGEHNYYMLAISADEDPADAKIAVGKAYGSLTSDMGTLKLDAYIDAQRNSPKDVETFKRLASAVKDEMCKIRQEDKQARFDELIDKIAAEHRENKYKKKPSWFHDLITGKICIVFNEPREYVKFRSDFSDVLLLPKTKDIYAEYPEIAENQWPVIIHSARNPVTQDSMTWAIAQTDYRNNRLISGREWFEYDELEDYDCAKTYNKSCWEIARMLRGKNTPAPGEKREDEDDEH